MPIKPDTKKKFEKRVGSYLNKTGSVTDQETRRMVDLLKDARKKVIGDLKNLPPTEWRAWYLPQLRSGIDARIGDLTGDIVSGMNSAQARMFDLIIDKADEMAGAAGIDVVAGMIDPNIISATQTLTGELISSVPAKIRDQIMNDISLGMMQGKSINEVIQDMNDHWDASYFDLERIANTEMMRAQSIAQQARFGQIVDLQPGLLKTWRWSAKPGGRVGHAKAEMDYTLNPIPFNKPFMVSPDGIKPREPLQYPRDPMGSPANTIYCGCIHLLVRP